MSRMQFVIPGLTEPAPYLIRGNPVLFWIPAGVYPVLRYGAGMTGLVVINGAVLNHEESYNFMFPTLITVRIKDMTMKPTISPMITMMEGSTSTRTLFVVFLNRSSNI